MGKQGLCSPRAPQHWQAEEWGLSAAMGHTRREHSLPVWISYSVYLLAGKLAHTVSSNDSPNHLCSQESAFSVFPTLGVPW